MPSLSSNFLTGGSNSSVKCFEIRVEEDHLIFRGNEDEASSALLKGTLVICNSEPIKVPKGIHLKLQGISRSGFTTAAASGTKLHKQETTFLEKRWDFDSQNENKKQQETLPAGNHEWPFEFELRGELPESVEGLPLSWVIYRLKATMGRGVIAKDLYARKHIRLIRTFNVDSLDLSHAMSVENVWPDKIQYSVSTPSKGVVFGTQVRIDYELVPLLKGLKIGKVKTEISEASEVKVQERGSHMQKKDERTVANDQYEIPEYVEAEDIDGQDGYRFSRYLQLPRRLQQCVQTVELQNIIVKHNMKFSVQLINPDGHHSELRASLPLRIFISPNVRLNERHELTNAAPLIPGLDDSTLAPPGYGEHQLDPLYDGVDPRGFTTPGGATPHDRSRRGSAEDLTLESIANNEVSANTLHNRLINLTTTDPVSGRRSAVSAVSGSVSPSRSPADGLPIPRNASFTTSASLPRNASFTGSLPILGRNASFPTSASLSGASPARGTGTGTGPGVSRSSSGDRGGDGARDVHNSPPSSGAHTPMHLEYNDAALSRVPSYNTAVHSNPRTPFSNDLPDYFAATSRPPTPPSEGATTPAEDVGGGPQAGGRHARFAGGPLETHVIERRGQLVGDGNGSGSGSGFHGLRIPVVRARH